MMPMFSPEDLFLRDSDRERLAMSYNALVTKRQSLLMLSENDVLLEHYGRMLIRMLRETSDVEVEVYFPSSTDALVQRFNDILAPLSVEDAMSILGPALPARVLVMHDAKSVKRQQVELLARLVNDFPGANVRLVMLLNETTERREDLASFGKRTARWTIETPTPVVADVFLQKAASVGMAGAATHLIDRLGLRQVDADTLAQDDELADGLPYEAEVFGADDQASTAWGWRRWLMTLFVAVSLLILSAVLVLSLYPKHRDAVLDLIWPELAVNAGEATADIPADDGGALLKKDATQPPAEVVQTEPSSPAAEAAVSEPPPSPSPPERPEQIAPVAMRAVPVAPLPGILPPWADVRTDLQISRELRNEFNREAEEKFLPDSRKQWSDDRFAVVAMPPAPAVALAPAPSPAPSSAPANTSTPTPAPAATPKQADAPTVTAKPAKAAVKSGTGLGHDWVTTLPDRYWVLQYASVVSAEQAQAWIIAHPKLDRLHVVAAVKSNGLPHHVVVRGPFKNRGEAQAFATSADSPKEYWARSVKSLRGVLRAD